MNRRTSCLMVFSVLLFTVSHVGADPLDLGQEAHLNGVHAFKNQKYKEAETFFIQAAEESNAFAMGFLGLLYSGSIPGAQEVGVPKNTAASNDWYVREKAQHEKDLSRYKQAAHSGSAEAMAKIEEMYEKGYGVRQNKWTAGLWRKKATRKDEQDAAKGDPAAIARFDKRCTEGYISVGVKDPIQKAKWCLIAAKGGHPASQLRLGQMYYSGFGVTPDKVVALHWLTMAEAAGKEEARPYLAEIYLGLGDVPHDWQKALDLANRTEDDGGFGQSLKLYTLARLQEEGWGIPQDKTRALNLFRESTGFNYEVNDVIDRIYVLDGSAALENLAKKDDPAGPQASTPAAPAAPAASETVAATASGVSREELLTLLSEAMKTRDPKPVPETTTDTFGSSDIDKPLYSLPEQKDDVAIVIGIDEYNELPPAKFAERDARAVKNHLLALGYPERNIIHIAGSKAGKAGIKKYLESWLPQNVKKNSRVFFYFSGHGAPDPESGAAYLVPWDGDANFLEDTTYPVKRLYEKLGALQAKEIVVALDACFSGGGGRSVLPDGARPLVTRVRALPVQSTKMVILTAAANNQITTTLDRESHGIFTYYLLKGLAGDALGADRKVTASGLFDYLKPKVQTEARRQGRTQTPTLTNGFDTSLILRGE